jgi:hemerythrin-like domain-containing protein
MTPKKYFKETAMRHPSLIPLSHDHHHGLALALRCRKQALGQIKPMGQRGLQNRAQEVSQFFYDNLVAHFCAEERVLFPLVESLVPESRSIVNRLLQEHEQIRAAILLLEGSSGLAKVLFDLGDLLECHIRTEERELFPLYEKHVNAKDTERVSDEIQKALRQRRS